MYLAECLLLIVNIINITVVPVLSRKTGVTDPE